jgi:radical SAM protein with 4Fe4S-binding SPASM domain
VSAAPHPVRFLDEEDQHRRIPVSVVWEITSACDLKCVHCGSRAGRRRRDELSVRECLALIDDLAALGVRDVGLIGGETYLRPDWLDLIRAIRAAGMDCSLQTGGRNMDERRIAAAAEAGLQGMGVSLDGLSDTHDRLRGVAGSFDRAVAVLERLPAFGITASVNTQISRLSMPELPALLERLIDLSVSNWQLALTVAMGNAADRPDLIVQPYELLELFPMLADLSERGREAGLVLQPSNNIGYFGPFERRLRHVNEEIAHWTGCSAGDNVLGIEADGSIKGCPGLPGAYIGGNVRDAPIAEIWARPERLAFTRGASVDDLWGQCRQCYYAELCMGGCTWTAHSLFGKAGNNPLCHYRALDFQRRGLRERLVQVAPAPGLRFDHGRYEIVVEPADAVAPGEPNSHRG